MKEEPARGGQSLPQIRSATFNDARSIADLHGRSFLATYPDLSNTRKATENGAAQRLALWASRIQDPPAGCAVFVAYDGDWILGFVYGGPTPDTDNDPGRVGQVFSIHVDPPAWGTGIGRALLERAVAFLRSSGFEDATLWVVEDNSRARKFYEVAGWKLDGAQRTETLAVASDGGDEVSVIRYRRVLNTGEGG